MKTFTNFFVVLIFFCMSFVVTNAQAIINQGSCGDNVNWVLTDDYTLTISGSGKMNDYVCCGQTRPWDSYTNKDFIFGGGGIIRSVVIQDGVTSVGNWAFYMCNGLTAVELPNSLITIGTNAFYGCNAFTSIIIPDNVTTIKESAFHGCEKLQTVEISRSATDIGSFAFYATNLKSITSHAATPPRLGERVFGNWNFSISPDIPVYIPSCSYYAYNTAPEWSRFTNFIVDGKSANSLNPEICMISVDRENHNKVVWKKQEEIYAYKIYREGNIAGQFDLMTTINDDAPNSWIDMESNARVRAYRYKITGLDACGNESVLSAPHKTMHLTISQGVGNSWNLMWTPYEGVGYSTYRIYRAVGETLGEMELIATMSSSNVSYTDFVNANSYIYYVVEIMIADACEIFAKMKSTNVETPVGSIRSNIVTNNPNVSTGLECVNANDFVQIYPNPVKDELRIANNELKISKIAILDLVGQTIYQFNNTNLINVSHLPSGTYFIRIETDSGIVTKKFIKE